MTFHKTKLYQLLPWLAVASLLGGAVPAQAAATNLNQTITSGLLVLTAPTSASLPSATTRADSDGSSTGPLGTVQVTDSRGTNAGWSLTASASNFTQIKPPVPSRQGSPTVTGSGTYTGAGNGQYNLTITTGGSLGTAQFQYNGLESDTLNTIPANGNVALGTKGVLLSFTPGTYQVGDKYTIEADTIGASNLQVTPAAFTTLSGQASGVHTGSAYQFTGTTDTATLMAADSGSGFGSYSIAPTLQLTIPARSPIGTYTATLTETLN